MTAALGQKQLHATPVPIAPDPLSLSSDWKVTSEASIRRTRNRKTRPSTPSSRLMRQSMASNTSVRRLRLTHSSHYVRICVGKTAIRTTSMRSRSTESGIWFGSEEASGNWHALRRAVGIKPLPCDHNACRKALRENYVNLIDLFHWTRAKSHKKEEVKIFQSVEELRKYCRRQKKWFPLKNVHGSGDQGDRKVVIRHLLRTLF